MMKKFFLDFVWFLLFTLAIGLIEFLFKLLFGWVLTWSSAAQVTFVMMGLGVLGILFAFASSLIAVFPFKTYFWLILSELGIIIELIGGLIGIWGQWWWDETTKWDIVIKVVASIYFIVMIGVGGWSLYKDFKERIKHDQY